LDGFIHLVKDLLIAGGIPESSIIYRGSLELPGYFRPEKQWDLFVIVDGHLLASIEFKAQIGPSFGNNFNNRTEEALGNATDFWTAYREGAFRNSPRPWLGYIMLLEEAPKSMNPVRVYEPHFQVFEEFRGTSYAQRYELLLTRLMHERLYDASCLLLSDKEGGTQNGSYREPSQELSFHRFSASLLAQAIAYVKTQGS
jgi:restriction endonuclease XhoI-like protein